VKRSPELAPLSRDHHVALERALRLRRATEADLDDAVARFLAFFTADGERHFEQEEDLLLPLVPPGSAALGERMCSEHAEIRSRARSLADAPEVTAANELGALLNAHVRFEERELFPLLEEAVPAETLADVGRRLGDPAGGA
jgi:hemerythrin-like domain-containing protein